MVKHGRQAGRRLVGGPTPGYAGQRPGIYTIIWGIIGNVAF